MDRGAWQTTVHEVEKSQRQLSNWAHTHRAMETTAVTRKCRKRTVLMETTAVTRKWNEQKFQERQLMSDDGDDDHNNDSDDGGG